MADLTTKLESVEDAARMYKDSSKEKAKQVAKLKETFSGSGAELNQLKVKYELLLHKHEKMEDENKQLVNMANEKARHNADFLSEISKLKLQNLMMMKEMNANEMNNPIYGGDNNSGDVEELQRQIKKLKDENQRLRATVTMKQMTEANCISEISELQEKLNKKNIQLKHTENKFSKQQQWVDDVIYDKVKSATPRVEKVNSLSLPNIHRATSLTGSPTPTAARSYNSDSKLGPRARMQGSYSKRKK